MVGPVVFVVVLMVLTGHISFRGVANLPRGRILFRILDRMISQLQCIFLTLNCDYFSTRLIILSLRKRIVLANAWDCFRGKSGRDLVLFHRYTTHDNPPASGIM